MSCVSTRDAKPKADPIHQMTTWEKMDWVYPGVAQFRRVVEYEAVAEALVALRQRAMGTYGVRTRRAVLELIGDDIHRGEEIIFKHHPGGGLLAVDKNGVPLDANVDKPS